MGTQRALRKSRKIGIGILRWLWIAVVLPLVALLVEIVKWAWGEFASKLFGDSAVKVIEAFVANVVAWSPLAMRWIFIHPVEASAIWFFLVLSVIIAVVFWQTRDPKGIRAFVENSLTKGFVVSNHSGNDLYECTVSIREVDSKPVTHKNLEWGTSRDLRGEILTIKHTDKSPVSFNRVYGSIQSVSDQDQLAGAHELELCFHGNKHNGEVVSMPIYVTVRMEIEAETRRLFVEKVET